MIPSRQLRGDLQPPDRRPRCLLEYLLRPLAESFEFFWRGFRLRRRSSMNVTGDTFQRRSVVLPMSEVFDIANMSESALAAM